jgi:hypothetical protein
VRSVSTGTFFTSKASKLSTVTAELIFDAPDVGAVEAVGERAVYCRRLRQYMYFFTNKTSKLRCPMLAPLKSSASDPSPSPPVRFCTFVLVKQVN